MTDKQQPPERIWLSRFWANFTEHNCQFSYEQKQADDIEFVPRIHPVDDARVEEIEAKAKRIASEYIRSLDYMSPEAAKWKMGQAIASVMLPQLSISELARHVAEFNVQWRRPNEAEVLECHGLTAASLALRIRAAIRSYGRVELLSLTPTPTNSSLSDDIDQHGWHVPIDQSNAAQTESSERRCAECGHDNVGADGICEEQRTAPSVATDWKAIRCGHKCAFTANGGNDREAAGNQNLPKTV